MLLTVSTLSRKYEQLYDKFKKQSSSDVAFCAINEAMMLSYFSKYIKIKGEINYSELRQQVEKKYGNLFFFNSCLKSKEYDEYFEESFNVFINEFSNSNDIDALEQLLGNILEKHINQKDTGSYYTPKDTTKYIAWNSIFMSLLNTLDLIEKHEILQSLNINKVTDILFNDVDIDEYIKRLGQNVSLRLKKILITNLYKLKIIDPTCGSGAFIISAFECLESLMDALGEENIRYSKIIKCLYGVDISNEAIQLTKLRLLLKIVKCNYNSSRLTNIFLNNFKVADALQGSDFIISEKGFDWKIFKTKFDCIIGNPPYVESKGDKTVSNNFITKKCGNLYAYTIERACNIAYNGSIIAFIVPLSFVSTPRMQTAKKYLEDRSCRVFYSTFADRPGCIFSGVHQRLTIFFAEISKGGSLECFSSSYNYWYNNERSELFNNLRYYRNIYNGILPKIGNEIEMNIFEKMKDQPISVMSLIKENGKYPFYLSTRIGFWAKAFVSNVFSSNEFKEFYTDDERIMKLLVALFNSSIFYFFWVVTSDCWHVTRSNIIDFKLNINRISDTLLNNNAILVDELMNDLEKNKKRIASKQTEYEYKHKYSKNIIDKIDDNLSELFSLTEEELMYIKKYTEKYRLNKLEN